MISKEKTGWVGRASFAGKSFDSVVTLFRWVSSVSSAGAYVFLNLSCNFSLPYMAKVHSEPSQTCQLEFFIQNN